MSVSHFGSQPAELSPLSQAIYSAGHMAFFMGTGSLMNPYRFGTYEHSLWRRGRMDAEAVVLEMGKQPV